MGLFSFLAKRRTIYLRVYPNKMEVRDIDFKDAVTNSSAKPFSSSNALISNLEEAEKLFRKTLWKFETGKFFRRDFTLLIQPMVTKYLSEKDRKSLKNIGVAAGAEVIKFTDVKDLLNDEEIISIIKNS